LLLYKQKTKTALHARTYNGARVRQTCIACNAEGRARPRGRLTWGGWGVGPVGLVTYLVVDRATAGRQIWVGSIPIIVESKL